VVKSRIGDRRTCAMIGGDQGWTRTQDTPTKDYCVPIPLAALSSGHRGEARACFAGADAVVGNALRGMQRMSESSATGDWGDGWDQS
jgi:hypothetical protein